MAVETRKKNIIDTMQHAQSSMLQMDHSWLDTSAVVTYIANLLEAQTITGHKIQLLKVRTVAGINALPVKITATGDFIEFYHFILSLLAEAKPIVITDFSFKQDDMGEVEGEMELLMFGIKIDAHPTHNLDTSVTQGS